MGIDRLHVIDSGVDPQLGAPGSAAMTAATCSRSGGAWPSATSGTPRPTRGWRHAGVRVIRVPSSELGSMRGGPRCMTCPVGRDPAAQGAGDAPAARPAPASGHAADLTIPRISLSGRSGVSQPAAVPAALAAAASPAGGAGVSAADLAAEPLADLAADLAERDPAGRDQAELASAGLVAAAGPASRPPAEPEDAQRHADEQHDQRRSGPARRRS